MQVPKSRSRYLPELPIEATKIRTLLLLLGICTLLFSLPAILTPDEVAVYTDSSTLIIRSTQGGEITSDTISYQFITHTSGFRTNGTIRVTAHARWGGPYRNFENDDRTNLQTAFIIAPSNWPERKTINEGEVLMNNVSSIRKGGEIQFEKDLHVPENIAVSGIGPDKATLYYFIQEDPDTGPSRFGKLRTYNVYRGFWDRPRTYSLLVSMIITAAIVTTYHSSVRQILQNILNQYVEYQWRSDLEKTAKSLESRFNEFTVGETYASELLDEIRNTSYDDLSTAATKLDEFQQLYQSISTTNKELLTSPLHHSLQSVSAVAFQENDISKAGKLKEAIQELEKGITVEVRGDSYMIGQPRKDLQSSLESGSTDEVNKAVDDLSRFQDAKKTVERWSQMKSTAAGPHHTAIAAYIDGERVEPTALWSNIEQSLTRNNLDLFIEEAQTVAQIASITEPLRTTTPTNENLDHLITNPGTENRLAKKAHKAMQSGNPARLKDVLCEVEAKAAEDDILKRLSTTKLTHTSIKPDRITDRVETARARENWEQIKQLRDELENRIDSAWRPSDLLTLKPVQFEKILGLMYSQMGYNIQVTQQSGDRGVDVIASDGQNTLAIQAKRYNPSGTGNVSGPEVRNAIGATVQKGADICVVATSSGFSEDAVRAAKETNLIKVELLTGQDIASKLSEVNIPKP